MKRIFAILLILALALALPASAAGGSASDPLISQSYADNTYAPSVVDSAIAAAETAFGQLEENLSARLEALDLASAGDGYRFADPYTTVSLSAGTSVVMPLGSSFILCTGSASVSFSSGTVVDISTGSTVASGTALDAYSRYFVAEDTIAHFSATSATVEAMVDGLYLLTDGSGVDSPFTDLDPDHWAADYILRLYDLGLINGMSATTYEPDGPMTRGMFVTVLGRLYGIDPTDYTENAYSDVRDDSYYTPYIVWATEAQLVNGYGGGIFQPDQPVSRQEIATILLRYANYTGATLSTAVEPVTFVDEDTIASWALEAVQACQRAGILQGRPGNVFDPANSAQRAEVAAVICRFIDQL